MPWLGPLWAVLECLFSLYFSLYFSEPPAFYGTCCHQLDHSLAVEAWGLGLGYHLAEAQDGDIVGYLEHIVEVVGNDEYTVALLRQPPDEL